ncbi:uncharacterized protein N7483_001827 [Penicillium malachiteum]|uniref:uncharacterized protein n=1 Tax=Penicillium malachiteum TaxID=1324776 RepID=UPI002548B751|nr:uncharacterized protein N7483_001827 [Penicillium malachiteum]KAJ5736702.1 hypothetical protein N7483_001827 [Penicillium malachiteum]
MPRWGRPPGARMGRHNGGRAIWEEDTRVEELISDNDDVFGRELVRGAGRYTRQQDYGAQSRGPRRRQEYEYEDWDDGESVVDGGDYDLNDYGDSTVAYAVQLAMRDKEDQLVDQALERIRRAQTMGKKNVRLSKRELAALERKRQQTSNAGAGPSASGTSRSRKGSTSSSRPSSRRNGHTVPLEQQPPQSGVYPPFAPDGGWSRPSSSSSAHRPRTPTMQPLRPQQSMSPLRPPYTSFPDRMPPNGRPQSMQQPMFARPLPDDPQWAPPYYNPMQMSPFAAEPPYQPQLPSDLRVGPQSRMSYPTGMPTGLSPIQAQTRQSVASTPAATPITPESESGSSKEEAGSSGEDSDVQIVRVVERQPQPQASPGVQRRPVGGQGRQGKSQ